MKTFSPSVQDIKREWVVIDARNQVLGRLASQIASLLRGKHKPVFAPHLDTGDFVVVVNADQVRLTGSKSSQKKIYTHSGYPGGLKTRDFADLLTSDPCRALERTVRGMLPKNSLGRAVFKKLRIYAGSEHPHAAQKPVAYAAVKISQTVSK